MIADAAGPKRNRVAAVVCKDSFLERKARLNEWKDF